MISQAMIRAERQAASDLVPYGWVITRDRKHELRPDEPSEVGQSGPSNAPDSYLVLAKAGSGIRFRLMDEGDLDMIEESEGNPLAADEDDPEYGVIYEGFLVDPEDSWTFGPLDDFGIPMGDCNGMKIYNDQTKRWEWV